MARAEFMARKQGSKENIALYLEHKYALVHKAFPCENEVNYTTLLSAVINGMANTIVKRVVRRNNPIMKINCVQSVYSL